jgi:glycosyltransferase involved in cell wall biosynthesis
MPNIVDPCEVVSPIRAPKYVTFVNPQTTKGAYVFVRIAEQLARRRPDIPLLVVESRGRAKESLEATSLDLSFAKNLFFMNTTTDPRQIYAVSKVVLMPSLWWESFGLVAAEAMANGIPVLASDRGALPETIGDAGLLFNIPERYTPTSTDVPMAAEVEPWVSAIERLWDDPVWYDDFAERGRKRAELWRPEVVGKKLYDFFAEAFPQPNPPFVPEPWPVDT